LSLVIALVSFKGAAYEDAKQWVCHFENYCEYRGLNAKKKLALCKVLLTPGAATWLDLLPDESKATWETLRGKILERYLTPEYLHFRSAKLIFNTKM